MHEIFATEVSVHAGVSYFAPVSTLTLPPSSQIARTAFCQYVCFSRKVLTVCCKFQLLFMPISPYIQNLRKLISNFMAPTYSAVSKQFPWRFSEDVSLYLWNVHTLLARDAFPFLFPYLTILALGIVIYLKISLLYRRKDGASNYYSSQSHSGASAFLYVHASIWS